jgi:membrane protease YdiL (CAAX protease family)
VSLPTKIRERLRQHAAHPRLARFLRIVAAHVNAPKSGPTSMRAAVEKQTLGSLWLQPFRWRSIAWACSLPFFNYAVLFPAGEWVRRTTGLPGFATRMDEVMRFPLCYRVLAVIGAGVVEETLFRGFTVTRLFALTGRLWLSATLALLGFSALHVPVWGWGFAVGGLVGGAAAMAFFLWRRDLLAMMVFHTVADATGLIIAPRSSDVASTTVQIYAVSGERCH